MNVYLKHVNASQGEKKIHNQVGKTCLEIFEPSPDVCQVAPGWVCAVVQRKEGLAEQCAGV